MIGISAAHTATLLSSNYFGVYLKSDGWKIYEASDKYIHTHAQGRERERTMRKRRTWRGIVNGKSNSNINFPYKVLFVCLLACLMFFSFTLALTIPFAISIGLSVEQFMYKIVHSFIHLFGFHCCNLHFPSIISFYLVFFFYSFRCCFALCRLSTEPLLILIECNHKSKVHRREKEMKEQRERERESIRQKL